MTQLIARTECQKLLIQSTTKLYSGEGDFIGTGFFILPNIIVSCYHVFFNDQPARSFKIEGHNFSIPVTPEHTFMVEGLDLVCIELTYDIGEQCIPLNSLKADANDEVWGYTFNTDYTDGAAIKSKIIEEVKHNGSATYRISDDSINQGSSGSPLWNHSKNCLLGVVYWLKEHKRHALVIPALNFEKHFPTLYEKNIAYHQEDTTWKRAIEKDQQLHSSDTTLVKKKTHSEQFEIYSHTYVGRTSTKTKLKSFLEGDANFIFIYGIGGIGKSHMIKSVVEELKIRFTYIRLTPSSNIKGLAYQLGLSNIEKEHTGGINRNLIEGIQLIDECIIIDDFYEIEDDVDLQNTLLQLASVSQGKIILISRALPEFYTSISYSLPSIYIDYLEREEHRQFVTEFTRFKSIGERALIPYEKKLWEVSRGHPLIAQIIINYSDDDIYDDFDIDALEAWDFEADREGKIFISKLLDTVLQKGKETEKEFLLSFSLILGQVPSPLLKRLPGFHTDNLKSLIKRKHFIQTLTVTDQEKTYNIHPLVRELLRKKAGERPIVHQVAAQFFEEKAQATQYEDMVAFNNALYHYQNSESEAYDEFIKSTNDVFLSKQIKDLINSNIDGSIARLKERQRRNPFDPGAYNELSRLYRLRGQEEQCFDVLNKGLELDTSNEVLLFSKAYAYSYFQKQEKAEKIFEELANLDNTYAIFQLCRIAYKAGNYRSCIRLCDWLLWLEPENSQALQYKGMVLFQLKQYHEANTLFDQRLEQESEDSQALLYKGMVLFQLKQYLDATTRFDQILEQEPENSQALLYKGMVLFQRKQYHEATTLFDQILEQEPENSQALQYKGMVLFQRKQYHEALTLFDRKLEQEPENSQALLYQGMVLFQRKQYYEALTLFDQILEQEPENSQALQYQGMVLFQRKQYHEALTLFDQILEQEPENSQALLYKGMVLFQRKQYHEALTLFDQILEEEPENIQALLYKGMVLFQLKQYYEALTLFDQILEHEPEDIQAIQYKGMVLFQRKQYHEALTLFDQILEEEPENIQALQYKGMVLFQLKQYHEALTLFDQILEQEPENSQALLYKGKTLIHLNRLATAEEVLAKANQLDDKNVFIKTEFATALRLNGKAHDAIEVYEAAIQLHKKNIPSYNGLFRTYSENLKDYLRAIKVIDSLLTIKVYDFRLLKAGIYLLIHRDYKIYDYDKARRYLKAMQKARFQNQQTKVTIMEELANKIESYAKRNERF